MYNGLAKKTQPKICVGNEKKCGGVCNKRHDSSEISRNLTHLERLTAAKFQMLEGQVSGTLHGDVDHCPVVLACAVALTLLIVQTSNGQDIAMRAGDTGEKERAQLPNNIQ